MPEDSRSEARGARGVLGSSEAPVPESDRTSHPAGGRTSDTALLSVERLTTVFDLPAGPAPAVIDVSFHVDPGETLCLVGESGSGKSVTALSILRLVQRPGRIAGGAIVFKGRDLLGLDEGAMQKVRGAEIGLVFQEPMTALNPVFTIGNQIEETLMVHGIARGREARTRAVELLDAVSVPEPQRRIRDYPHQLSGGLRQRALIALALACNPTLLIADEPTTALDVTIQAQILDLLRDLRQRFQLSLLLITHDLGVVAEMADRVAVMYAGRIVEQAPVRELFRDPRHPYTRGLLGVDSRWRARIEAAGDPGHGAAARQAAAGLRLRAAMPAPLRAMRRSPAGGDRDRGSRSEKRGPSRDAPGNAPRTSSPRASNLAPRTSNLKPRISILATPLAATSTPPPSTLKSGPR